MLVSPKYVSRDQESRVVELASELRRKLYVILEINFYRSLSNGTFPTLTFSNTDYFEEPLKGVLPVSSRYIIIPHDHISHFSVYLLERTSGAT